MSQPILIFPGLAAKFGVQLTLDKTNFVASDWSTGEIFASVVIDTKDGHSKRLIGPAALDSTSTLEDGTAAAWATGFVVVDFTSVQTAKATVFTHKARLQIGLDDRTTPTGVSTSTPWQSEQGFIVIAESHV